MSAKGITRISSLFAAALLLFAAAIVPICALIDACSMPCCERMPSTACAEQCGIGSNAAPHELPNAIPPPSPTTTIAVASLAVAEFAEPIAPAPAPRTAAFSAEVHRAAPGDTPVYLYNSVFLI